MSCNRRSKVFVILPPYGGTLLEDGPREGRRHVTILRWRSPSEVMTRNWPGPREPAHAGGADCRLHGSRYSGAFERVSERGRGVRQNAHEGGGVHRRRAFDSAEHAVLSLTDWPVCNDRPCVKRLVARKGTISFGSTVYFRCPTTHLS